MTDIVYNQNSDQVAARNTLIETSTTNALAAVRAGAYLKSVTAVVTPTSTELGSTTTNYAMVRLPSQAHIKEIDLRADRALDTSTTTTFAVNVGAAYSDAPSQSPPVLDGTQTSNQAATQGALRALLISASFFASARLFAGGGGDGQAATKAANFVALAPSSAATWGVAALNKELWDALGLTSDPGGYIDVTLAVQAAPTTTQTAAIAMTVFFD